MGREVSTHLRPRDPCPLCASRLNSALVGRLIALLHKRYWLRCTGWPKCEFARIYFPTKCS